MGVEGSNLRPEGIADANSYVLKASPETALYLENPIHPLYPKLFASGPPSTNYPFGINVFWA